jgi:hypothetical protein
MGFWVESYCVDADCASRGSNSAVVAETTSSFLTRTLLIIGDQGA